VANCADDEGIVHRQGSDTLLYARWPSECQGSGTLYALREAFSGQHGVVLVDGVDNRRRATEQRPSNEYSRNWPPPPYVRRVPGVVIDIPELYRRHCAGEIEIDSGVRTSLRLATWCKLPFALFRRGLQECVIHWHLGWLHLSESDKDRYCRLGSRHSQVRHPRASPRAQPRLSRYRDDTGNALDFDRAFVKPQIFSPNWRIIVGYCR